MSDWWSELDSSASIVPAINACTPHGSILDGSLNTCTPHTKLNDTFRTEKVFNSVKISYDQNNDIEVKEEGNRLILQLRCYTGSIDLSKIAPLARHISSFSVLRDESLRKPLEIPSWLTEPTNSNSPDDILSKRKAESKPYEYLKIPKITTPDVAQKPRDSNSADTKSISYGLNRSGQIAFLVPVTNKLYIHGGFTQDGSIAGDIVQILLHGDPICLATASRCITEIYPRIGHTCVRLSDELGLAVMFGGETPGSAVQLSEETSTLDADAEVGVETKENAGAMHNNKKVNHTQGAMCLDSLLVFDPKIDLWYPPAVSGKPPTSRSGHAAALLLGGRCMVIYGGSRFGRYLHNIHWLDLQRWHWNSPKCDGKPPRARAGHCCHPFTTLTLQEQTPNSNALVIFGGHDDRAMFNDVHVLTCHERKEGSGQCSWEWSQPTVSGSAPLPRTSFASCVVGQGRYLFIRGGYGFSKSHADDPSGNGPSYDVFSDCYLLDLHSWTWHMIVIYSESKAACEDNTEDIGVCGVRIVTDADSIDAVCTKSERAYFSQSMEGRVGESAISMIEKGEEFILLFGGRQMSGEESKYDPLIGTPCSNLAKIRVKTMLASVGRY